MSLFTCAVCKSLSASEAKSNYHYYSFIVIAPFLIYTLYKWKFICIRTYNERRLTAKPSEFIYITTMVQCRILRFVVPCRPYQCLSKYSMYMYTYTYLYIYIDIAEHHASVHQLRVYIYLRLRIAGDREHFKNVIYIRCMYICAYSENFCCCANNMAIPFGKWQMPLRRYCEFSDIVHSFKWISHRICIYNTCISHHIYIFICI